MFISESIIKIGKLLIKKRRLPLIYKRKVFCLRNELSKK